MDIRKLSVILTTLGAVVTLGALVWWASFYGAVTRELKANLSDALSCLYSGGGGCGFVSGLAQMAGRTPYTPVVFWIGIGLLACGIIVWLAQKSEPAGSREEEAVPLSGPALPHIPEGYKFSAREAAQAIGVTGGTLQGYVKSKRVTPKTDGTIDAAELLRAGFIIRHFPTCRG